MEKNKTDWVKDKVDTADSQYNRMIGNLEKGIVNIGEIIAAMTVINLAHQVALHENRRELVK